MRKIRRNTSFLPNHDLVKLLLSKTQKPKSIDLGFCMRFGKQRYFKNAKGVCTLIFIASKLLEFIPTKP
jgi:hypothetical protein